MISRCDISEAVRARASAASGFTLIEMIVVLAIIALVSTLVTIRGRPDSPATHARAAAREISGALRTARTESIMTNRSISFTLDVANRSYRWGQQTLRVLPNDLRLALFTSRDQLVAETAGRIRFD